MSLPTRGICPCIARIPGPIVRSRVALALALGITGALGLASCGPDPDRPPNVVIILADDMGIGDPGVYNEDSGVPTPHIDALATEGMRFTDAHTPSAVCSPTRYGLLTGRYAWRTRLKSGVLWTDDPALIEPERVTMASLLRENGYATAGFGKWHLGLGPEKPTDYSGASGGFPRDLGFDAYFGIPSSLDIPPYVWVTANGAEALPTDSVEGSTMRRSGGGGFWRAGRASPGFDFQAVLPTIVERAADYIASRASEPDRPFFVYVPLSAPHTPWLPDSAHVGRTTAGPYGDFASQVDDAVGDIVGAVDRAGFRDNTVVVFTSDNGAHWTSSDMERWTHRANGPWRGQKADIHEAGHRVPFVVRWQERVKPGSVSDQLVSLVDLLTTTASLTGVSLPSGAAEDGFDASPILLGIEGATGRSSLVLHSLNGMFAIRKGRWKLVEGLGSGGFTAPANVDPVPGGPEGQLYDLVDDPGETTNQWLARPDVVSELLGELRQIRGDQPERAQSGDGSAE